MAGTQPGEIVGKVVGIKKATRVAILRPVVPNLVLGAHITTAPGIAQGIGGFPGLLQIGDFRASTGLGFGNRVGAKNRRKEEKQKCEHFEHNNGV